MYIAGGLGGEGEKACDKKVGEWFGLIRNEKNTRIDVFFIAISFAMLIDNSSQKQECALKTALPFAVRLRFPSWHLRAKIHVYTRNMSSHNQKNCSFLTTCMLIFFFCCVYGVPHLHPITPNSDAMRNLKKKYALLCKSLQCIFGSCHKQCLHAQLWFAFSINHKKWYARLPPCGNWTVESILMLVSDRVDFPPAKNG